MISKYIHAISENDRPKEYWANWICPVKGWGLIPNGNAINPERKYINML
jgi:hypothetical protein